MTPSGYATAADGTRYCVADGVVYLVSGTPAQAGTEAAGLSATAYEMLDVQQIINGDGPGNSVIGGAGRIGAVIIAGTTYVIGAATSVGTAATAAEVAADQQNDTIFQLNGIPTVTELGIASLDGVYFGAGSTILITSGGAVPIALPNAGHTGGASGNTAYDDVGYAVDSMTAASATGTTNSYFNLGGQALLYVGGGATGGTINITQLGVTGNDSLDLIATGAGATLDNVITRGDASLAIDATAAGVTIKTLTDTSGFLDTIRRNRQSRSCDRQRS